MGGMRDTNVRAVCRPSLAVLHCFVLLGITLFIGCGGKTEGQTDDAGSSGSSGGSGGSSSGASSGGSGGGSGGALDASLPEVGTLACDRSDGTCIFGSSSKAGLIDHAA